MSGFWDTLKSVGGKVKGAVESIGSKGLHEFNVTGGKVAAFGKQALENEGVQAFLATQPELAAGAVGAFGLLEGGLAISGKLEQGVSQLEKSGILKAREEDPVYKPAVPPKGGKQPTRQQGMLGPGKPARAPVEQALPSVLNPGMPARGGRRAMGSTTQPNTPPAGGFGLAGPQFRGLPRQGKIARNVPVARITKSEQRSRAKR